MEQKGVQIDTEMSESVPESSNFPALHTSRVWVYGKWSTPCPSCAKYHVMLLTSVPSFRSFGITEVGGKVGSVGGWDRLATAQRRAMVALAPEQVALRANRRILCMGAVAMGKELNM